MFEGNNDNCFLLR